MKYSNQDRPHKLRPFLLKGATRQGKLRYVYLQSRDSKFH